MQDADACDPMQECRKTRSISPLGGSYYQDDLVTCSHIFGARQPRHISIDEKYRFSPVAKTYCLTASSTSAYFSRGLGMKWQRSAQIERTGSRRDRMRTSEAARYLAVSESLLEKLRLRGTGPRYAKLGKKIVVYEVADLDAWADAAKRSSTSEPEAA
jgi:predicted DNA-binding transcriptional regulator AlpA